MDVDARPRRHRRAVAARRLRLRRLFSAAAPPVADGRCRILRLAKHRSRTGEVTGALQLPTALPDPD
ncbi:hypothetical protein [Streptomyces pacificus]|uniref:hypothetical protein n=1 Tax=Streptomyces pacificus TaxID=2705029 RepID=UPI001567383B|nr:hypothetical protein [Streptomyces pacificus]